MIRLRRARLPHPSTDLRLVYAIEDPLRREVERLAEIRDVEPPGSEEFARKAQALARADRPVLADAVVRVLR